METDPLFEPLAGTFRAAVLRSIVSQLDQSKVVRSDIDRSGQEFSDAVYTIAFFVLAQLEEGSGFEEGRDKYYSHLVFTPVGETPVNTTRMISQKGRIIVHGGLSDEEVTSAISDYLNS